MIIDILPTEKASTFPLSRREGFLQCYIPRESKLNRIYFIKFLLLEKLRVFRRLYLYILRVLSIYFFFKGCNNKFEFCIQCMALDVTQFNIIKQRVKIRQKNSSIALRFPCRRHRRCRRLLHDGVQRQAGKSQIKII